MQVFRFTSNPVCVSVLADSQFKKENNEKDNYIRFCSVTTVVALNAKKNVKNKKWRNESRGAVYLHNLNI